jgi:hypothetical protein
VVDVSTYANIAFGRDSAGCREALHEVLRRAETIPALLSPDELPECLALLDRLDAMLGYLDPEDRARGAGGGILSRAKAMKGRLEEASERVYESVRLEVATSGESRTLRGWLAGPEGSGEEGGPRRGLGFDLRDEILSGVLQLSEPGETERRCSGEMAPYQPTPVRHIVDLISTAKISGDDVLIDLGSGLGHVPLLVSMLTGSRTLGVEFEAAYVASAEVCAERLNLRRVRFVAEDARVADLSSGTVFYLFSPFTGSTLDDVLDRLEMESIGRQIRVCSLGPCTRVLAEQRWLKSREEPDAGRITVFTSR